MMALEGSTTLISLLRIPQANQMILYIVAYTDTKQPAGTIYLYILDWTLDAEWCMLAFHIHH